MVLVIVVLALGAWIWAEAASDLAYQRAEEHRVRRAPEPRRWLQRRPSAADVAPAGRADIERAERTAWLAEGLRLATFALLLWDKAGRGDRGPAALEAAAAAYFAMAFARLALAAAARGRPDVAAERGAEARAVYGAAARWLGAGEVAVLGGALLATALAGAG